MFSVVRMIGIAVQSLLTKKAKAEDEWSELRLRAMPWDCDLNMHINNAKYLSILDLARGQLFYRRGFLKLFSSNRWNPVVTSANVVYRRSINLWSKYTVRSRIAYKTDRLLLVEHVFEQGNTLYAHAYIAVALLEKGKMITLDQVQSQLCLKHISEPEPGSGVQSVIDAAYEVVKSYR